MKIIDNFLYKKDHEDIYHALMGERFPWFFSNRVVDPHEMNGEVLDNFQFYHSMFDKYRQKSEFYELAKPLIYTINPKALIRIKANLIPRHNKIITHGYHNDTDFDNVTAIYYVNTNNGYTKFENGEKIESVANRIVFFDSSMKHSGTTCTDQQTRVVINLNFF